MNKSWLIGLLLSLWAIVPQTLLAQGETLTRSAYKVLDNRFRLDHGIDEVTLVIYRTPGAGPAVLVRPDGSKLYAHTTPDHVSWFGGGDYDVITIQSPMPGPWQIIGSLDRRNKIEILSDLQLVIDQAPKRLYQNERLKLTAHLKNYDNKLNVDAFYQSTELGLYLLRRRVTGVKGNGLSDTNKVGRFLDNGTGLDEYPRDGVFTGELDFTLDPGRYQLYMNVRNRTFSRVATQDIELKKNPVKTKVVWVKGSAETLHLTINTNEIDLESAALNLLVQGSADFQHPFTITAPKQAQVDVALDFIEHTGDFKVSGWLFGNTMFGREVAIAIPSERFSVIRKGSKLPLSQNAGESEVTLPKLSTGNRRLVTGSKTTEPVMTNENESSAEAPAQEPSSLWIWLLVVIVLLLLIILAGVAWFFIKFKKSTASGQDSGKESEDAEIDLNSPEER